jgi:hypothetical protein
VKDNQQRVMEAIALELNVEKANNLQLNFHIKIKLLEIEKILLEQNLLLNSE